MTYSKIEKFSPLRRPILKFLNTKNEKIKTPFIN
jgi:hypothetical protein